MELNFLGRGSAFNPKEGNTSAYFIEERTLFLIDCGETIFSKLMELDLLSDIDTINLIITHTHSDHIGSLGSLVLYSYYVLNKPLNIITSLYCKHLPNIEKILKGFGCTNNMYSFIDIEKYDNKFTSFNLVRFIETNHVKELHSYSLLFNTLNGLVYYSGDTCEIDVIKLLIESGQVIDKMYIETTSVDYDNNIHLYIDKLKKVIPDNLKDKVYCMHVNNDECINNVIENGFNMVDVVNNKRLILKKEKK